MRDQDSGIAKAVPGLSASRIAIPWGHDRMLMRRTWTFDICTVFHMGPRKRLANRMTSMFCIISLPK